MSARSRTNKSPAFERAGSARSARGQQPLQPLLHVVAAVLPQRQSSLRRRLRRRRPMRLRCDVAVVRLRLRRCPSRLRPSLRFLPSRQFLALVSSTRRQKQGRQQSLLSQRLLLRSSGRTVEPRPKFLRWLRIQQFHPRLRSPPRRRQPNILLHPRRLRLRPNRPHRSRRPSRLPRGPALSVRVRDQLFRARRGRAQWPRELRSRRPAPWLQPRPVRRPVSPDPDATTDRGLTTAVAVAERRASAAPWIRKQCRRAFLGL